MRSIVIVLGSNMSMLIRGFWIIKRIGNKLRGCYPKNKHMQYPIRPMEKANTANLYWVSAHEGLIHLKMHLKNN